MNILTRYQQSFWIGGEMMQTKWKQLLSFFTNKKAHLKKMGFVVPTRIELVSKV